MTNEHTQGRLAYVERGDAFCHAVFKEQGDQVAVVVSATQTQQGDARRLAACWNACQGISTEVLEREQYLQTASYSLRHAAETQIVELLAALERLVRFIEIEDAHLANFGEVESARTAIARVKGGSGPTNITTHALELAAQAIASVKGGA